MKAVIRTPEERRQMRLQGDRRARVCQIQLWCTASILRTVVTEIIPLCGSAGWWMAAVCLMPGVAVFLLLRWMMRRTGAGTLNEGIRRSTGQAGVRCFSVLMPLLLMLDGAASMTALVTIFTEGIGTEGTQITMAALTLAAVAGCLHRDGLPWGIWLMRRGLLLIALAAAGVMLGMIRPDGLHPLLGQGGHAVLAAGRAGASMGWCLILLLTVEDAGRGYAVRLTFPLAATIGAGLLLCLTYPCETLLQQGTLAEKLLQGALHLPPALRTVVHALIMLTLLLSIATAVQLATEQLLAPSGRELVWLPYLLAAGIAATQCLNIRRLWQVLNLLLHVGPVLLMAGALLLLFRRKPCSDASS